MDNNSAKREWHDMNFLSKWKQNLLSLSRSDIRSLSVNKTLSLKDQVLTPTRFQVSNSLKSAEPSYG